MPRSSESVAALAAALAKAQAVLVNPEKSLTASIRTGRVGEGERSFRYAPLSSGLDIVRKTLGQFEIATVQITAIDTASGMVSLTTMLAHASGEWIASDWPVCSVAETANPQRMGAALTYARRYALFTLVGIAGEDDLDAPDLCGAPPAPGAKGLKPDRHLKPADPGRGPLGPELSPRSHGNGSGRQAAKAPTAPVLSPDESAALRERLLHGVAELRSSESATTWARGALAAKNRLVVGDARRLEEAFAQRLSAISVSEDETPQEGGSAQAALATDEQAREELGDAYALVEVGETATVERLLRDLDVEERLEARIEKCLKRLLVLRGLKSISAVYSSPSPRRIQGPPAEAA